MDNVQHNVGIMNQPLSPTSTESAHKMSLFEGNRHCISELMAEPFKE